MAGNSGVDYATPLSSSFHLMEAGAQKARESYNELVRAASALSPLSGPVAVLQVQHNLGSIRSELDKILKKVEYALQHWAPVLSLISTSLEWVGHVKTPLSELSLRCTEPADEDLAKWTGDAASAYNRKAAQQKDAVNDTVLKAEYISSWLFKVAQSNVDFAAQLAKIITNIAGKVAAAAAKAATVVLIPLIVQECSSAISSLVESGLNILVSVGQRFVQLLGDVRDLNGQIGDHTKLPGGSWPEAVGG
jgi:hypothetical protein